MIPIEQLNIHRFKVLARFGLMHICATNICVWIRTLVLESLKEIILYHLGRGPNPDDGAILESIRTHSLRHAGTVMGSNSGPEPDWEPIDLQIRDSNVGGIGNGIGSRPHQESDSILSRMVHTTARALTTVWSTSVAAVTETPTTSTTFAPLRMVPTTTTITTTPATTTTTTGAPLPIYESSFVRKLQDFVADVTTTTTAASPVTTNASPSVFDSLSEELNDDDTIDNMIGTATTVVSTSTSTLSSLADVFGSTTTPSTTTSIGESLYSMFSMDSVAQQLAAASASHSNDTLAEQSAAVEDRTFESLDALFPEALIGNGVGVGGGGVPTALTIIETAAAAAAANTSCGRVNIMGTIVQDSAPYLYPFVIEYSLIGAVVIYVMWKHIGRYPK